MNDKLRQFYEIDKKIKGLREARRALPKPLSVDDKRRWWGFTDEIVRGMQVQDDIRRNPRCV